ncbi:MAG: acyltransferase [Prevotella sp.]|nr:acyltransferase [Prevotella sp.]
MSADSSQSIVHGTDGTQGMHHALISVLRFMGLRPMYAVMAVFVVPFYIVLRRKAFMAIWHYMRQRQGFGRWKSFRMTYLNHYRFGQVVLDRFAMYAGIKFQLDRVNNELFTELSNGDEGFVILSCHVGCYEMAGYTFTATQKPYNTLVYGGETQSVMENRRRLFAMHNIRMITTSDDMSHIFEMNNALANGQIVSIPADRIFGSTRTVECQLLGAKANLPLGPFALATQREAKTIAIFVMKESAYRYTVYVRSVQADPQLKRNERTAALAQAFATEMETILKKYPEQWYNYYEFWD